jgi:hypothetical protein
MRYFGPKSLSSAAFIFLSIAWVLTIAVTAIAPIVGSAVIYFSTPQGEAFLEKASVQHASCLESKDALAKDMVVKDSDKKDWAQFKAVPLPVKILLLPYVLGVLSILIVAIRRARLLFKSFRDEPVFRGQNVELMRGLARLLILLGVVTFDFSTLLIALILLMACEVIKSGAALQEEHDLTV